MIHIYNILVAQNVQRNHFKVGHPCLYTENCMIFKGTRGGKSSEPEVVAVIPNYCATC